MSWIGSSILHLSMESQYSPMLFLSHLLLLLTKEIEDVILRVFSEIYDLPCWAFSMVRFPNRNQPPFKCDQGLHPLDCLPLSKTMSMTLPLCENYAIEPLFFLNFLLFIARPPVLGTTLNCIIMPHNYYGNTWHMLMVKIPCIGYNS